MSAYITIRRDDAVHVITDGASYDPDGVLHAVKQKCLQLGTMPAVVTARGWHRLTEILSTLGAATATAGFDFDMFLGWAQQGLLRTEARLIERGVPHEFEAVFAGWSDDLNRMAVFTWSAHDRYDAVPRTLIEVTDPILFAPVPDETYLRATGFQDVDRLEDFDVERHGLQLVEAQRRVRSGAADMGPVGRYLVGGHVDLTTVTRNGVTSKRLKNWDDQVGRKMHPEPVLVGASAEPLTRQQRRAMERQERKGSRAA